ncbi:bacteriophage Gp15 family protein [Bacillus sp. S0635]|uniref:Gp15 family bacteriophage protein n=1 Tax=Bacillus TaxID=1386 RepID=UPI0020A023FB|nr:Gp15 family bacteriophage protein [Bacillus sp. S0635]MCP1285377.1 bacteriophage Gp15 family protein [Bacillus sp. S0635]
MNNVFSLTDRKFDVIIWGGVAVELNLSFDNILMLLKMFDDKGVRDRDKPYIALNMLVVEKQLLSQLNGERRLKFLEDIFKEKLGIDLQSKKKNGQSQENTESQDDGSNGVPIVNYTVDAERIYSSFLIDYKIDLIAEQGKLLWNQFQALFNNLSENTPMKIAIKYRVCDVPKRTKDNAEEVKDIRRKKEYYELPEAKAIREANELRAYQRNMAAKKKAIMEMQGD